jgi:hypothetical protein
LKCQIKSLLEQFKATRFHNKSAAKLILMLDTTSIFCKNRAVLLEGLSEKDDSILVRDELMKRNPFFKLKSASDFMIDIGLSHDVIPF